MTLDLSRYRKAVKPVVLASLEREAEVPPMNLMGQLAIATNCPIIAIGYYIAELRGMTPGLREKLDRLILFYKITEITNQEAFLEAI